MTELLAPAGSFESLIAAISNGCDAIYLGLDCFGARAYAENFTFENIKQAIDYAHLRNVKLYITMNTIIFDEELERAYEQIDKIANLGVDGVIIQDIALIRYTKSKFKRIEAHVSTQAGIDDLSAVMFFKDLNVDRCVLAREMTKEEILDIKKKVNMPLEVFVHGALCVSYSGNCLMSGLIGYRSGNRGRCVGSCRKTFSLFDSKDNYYTKDCYILSMKDLNTLSEIRDLKYVDSLKIEGRMKESIYVANIVDKYRNAIDNENFDLKDANYKLSKTFNRTFTKGYLLKEDRAQVTNTERPNHYGYEIGEVISKRGNFYGIKLTDTLNQNDQVRINDISIPIVKMYDKDRRYINTSNTTCYLEFKEQANIGDKVYKTRDNEFNNGLTKTFPKEFRRFNLEMFVRLKVNEPISLTLMCEDKTITVSSSIYEQAINKPITEETIITQLSKLNDTVYQAGNIEIDYEEGFLPLKDLNELRRIGVEAMNNKRLEYTEETLKASSYTVPKHKITTPTLSAFVLNEEQYNACIEAGITNIYYKNVARRNKTTFPKDDKVLVGGYNGLHHYKGKDITTDFSLNVCNYEAVATLHNYGANLITLSHEMNKEQINNIPTNYYNKYNTYPNLELIVYGRADLMFTNYCPLKPFNLCGKCKNEQFFLSDEFGVFPVINHEDCSTTILNGKIFNLIDNLDEIKNINSYRLQFTIESKDEVLDIINKFKNKLYSNDNNKYFNKETDTRGHFNKQIL